MNDRELPKEFGVLLTLQINAIAILETTVNVVWCIGNIPWHCNLVNPAVQGRHIYLSVRVSMGVPAADLFDRIRRAAPHEKGGFACAIGTVKVGLQKELQQTQKTKKQSMDRPGKTPWWSNCNVMIIVTS